MFYWPRPTEAFVKSRCPPPSPSPHTLFLFSKLRKFYNFFQRSDYRLISYKISFLNIDISSVLFKKKKQETEKTQVYRGRYQSVYFLCNSFYFYLVDEKNQFIFIYKFTLSQLGGNLNIDLVNMFKHLESTISKSKYLIKSQQLNKFLET